MVTNNQKVSPGVKTGLGVGIAALAAAAAGAYYFYGSKHSPQHRKQMKGWMIKAKGEVVEKLENLKDMTQENYDKVVDQVMDKYGKAKNINPEDLKSMAADMRKHWKNISSQISPSKKRAVKKTTPKKVTTKNINVNKQ